MDPAQELEREILSLQDPMNAVIDNGDSPVQQFYDGTTVFVTGGSGFMGKSLIEKLFRACAINKMYLLLRARKGKTLQERIHYVLSDPVFDTVRNKQPKFADKIVALEGDVADIKLGLNENDWELLTKEVNIIFHVAATIRFDEPVDKATFVNVRGTREVVTLARECTKLKKLIHVSTAFCHATKDRINTDVNEQFYPCPLPPETMIQLAETLEVTRLNDMTMPLINGWPNTYTFTKALAENLIKNMAGDLPVCIVRPSIVLPAYYEPNPGWMDLRTIVGPSGLFLGIGLGIIQVFKTGSKQFISIVPVDYATNAIISAAWDSSDRRNDGEQIPIYATVKNISFGYGQEVLAKYFEKIVTPKAVWFCGTISVKSKLLYLILSWFLHYIPAYILDFVCKITGKMPKEINSIVEVYKKLDKLGAVYDYFIDNDWKFKDDNLKSMITRMNDADKKVFNCDVPNIDVEEFVLSWALGIRKYIIKDGLTGTAAAHKKQIIMRFVHYFVVLPSYMYALWWVFSTMIVFLYDLVCVFFL